MAFEVTIKNAGDGRMAEVTPSGQLKSSSESLSQQHVISKEFGQAYQAYGRTATLTAGTTTVLHLKNTDPNRDLVVSFIRIQAVGINVSDDVGNYFEFGFGRTVASGGTPATVTNLNRKRGIVASAVATDGSPTMAGTFAGIERWHPAASGEANTFRKDGSIILGLNDTLEIRYVGTSTTGIAEARITFMLVDK